MKSLIIIGFGVVSFFGLLGMAASELAPPPSSAPAAKQLKAAEPTAAPTSPTSTPYWNRSSTSEPAPAPAPPPTTPPSSSDTEYYANCSEARAAGAAPIYEGEPGYRSKLDRDNDGVACE